VSAEIVIVCGKCRQPVGPDSGCLWAGWTEINDTRAARTRWDTERAASAVTLQPLSPVPVQVGWKVAHEGCTTRPDDGYWIAVQALTTWRDLVWWTAHLMEKNWLHLTDWDQLLREAAGDGGPDPRITVRLRSAA
jgi:hypothetical protein